MTTDKHLLRNRFAAHFGSYNALAVVQEAICGELDALLGDCGLTAPRQALEIGAGTGFLTRRLVERYPQARWTVNDLVCEAQPYVEACAGTATVEYLWGDAESIALPSGQDLLASASTVQWFDDLPGFLQHAHALLNSGGVLALTTFGPENFREIKATTGDGLIYYSPEALRELVETSGFTIKNWREYTRQLTFDTPADVLRHIKATGLNAIRKTRWTRNRLAAFEAEYRRQFTDSQGKITLTYHPILFTAIKRSVSLENESPSLL